MVIYIIMNYVISTMYISQVLYDHTYTNTMPYELFMHLLRNEPSSKKCLYRLLTPEELSLSNL